MNQMSNVSKSIRVSLGGESIDCTEEGWKEAADALFAKHGGVPQVTRIDAVTPDQAMPAADAEFSADAEGPEAHADTVPPPPAPETTPVQVPTMPRATGLRLVVADPNAARGGIDIDAVGRDRSQADFDAAVAAGFAPAQTIYDRGTRVVEMGVNKARRLRQEFDGMPTVSAYCDDFEAHVANEDRTDLDVEVCTMKMLLTGELQFDDAGRPLTRTLTDTAFQGLCSRLGFGGAQYLRKCWTELRAHNVNEWLSRIAMAEQIVRQEAGMKGKRLEPRTLRLRERNAFNDEGEKTGREAFGVVTDSYTAWDVDKIAEAVKLASPADARGRVTYNGEKARFEVLFHSTVQPEHYVAGEFFRAGVVIDTDDTGSGSIGGSTVVSQNLCLNLIIIDQAKQGLFRIRHTGDLARLVRDFRAGFEKALGTLEHFRAAWGGAVEEDAVKRALTAADEQLIPIEKALPGLFRGIIEREMVPVFAKTEIVIPKLMKMWERDASSATAVTPGSRAAIVNAFTRYAHEATELTPWEEDEVQRSAGKLLYGARGNAKPAPLPYLREETETNPKK